MEQANAEETPDIKHWLFQIIPPLFLLCILLLTNNGNSLVFLAGLFVIPVIISVISIIAKCIKFKKRKYYLIRPLLTIAFFFLILIIAHWTYKSALDDAINAAELIHEECNKNTYCPDTPTGWEVDEIKISRNDLGFWFKYSAFYSYDPQSFNIHVYSGPDTGDIITGGVNIPFKVAPYVEN